MRALPFALALALTPLTTTAQSTEDLAREYAALPAVQEMTAAMFSPEASAAQIAATLPPGVELSESQLTDLGNLLSEELTGFQPRLEALMIDAMSETFTTEELSAMIEFYSSDVGRSILVQTQPMFTAIMADLAPEMQARMMGRQAEIMAIIMGQ
ncbi:DUF2059 domain-containing protein [Gymnodinialimonas ulvae]|uniref:DUF2059 domain-containing protein n=1 Tax=Gymnodinialimonas ulvae TaxID=3126504 RepID=UPI00309CE119